MPGLNPSPGVMNFITSARDRTYLSPNEESAFQAWAKKNGITDVDHPDSQYDYRGFWKLNPNFSHKQGEHFTDLFKQHNHPTFSQESQYSIGPSEGGMWLDDSFIPQPKMTRTGR